MPARSVPHGAGAQEPHTGSARPGPDAPPLPLVSAPSPSSVWLLLKNPTFILLCLAGATEATLIASMSTFGPKFLESQFSLSASEAATLFGENGAPGALGGSAFPPVLRGARGL